MPYDIIVGRTASDRKKFENKGTIFLGRSYVKMGQTTSLSNNVFMDVVRSHVVFVVGKRGSGKSYTAGVISEGMVDLPKEISKNLSIVMLDTMGIYWTMKYPNEKDESLLEQWKLKPKGLDIKIYTPVGYYQKALDVGIPTDSQFSLRASSLTAEEWRLAFELKQSNPVSVLIDKILNDFEDNNIKNYDIDDIINAIKTENTFAQETINEATNRFNAAKHWGLFSKEGTEISELVKPGQVTVLDVSAYATQPGGGWGVKSLVIGLIAQKIFIQRMISRKAEELEAIKTGYSYFQTEKETKKDIQPLVWFVIDEAHELLPDKGKTAATDPLVTILREGRQPGVSLLLISQQPGKIHSDVLTQSDIVIAHRLTAQRDVDALNAMTQSYTSGAISDYLRNLPSEKGAALILDDNSERLYPIRVRPKLSWHGGEAPTAIKYKRQLDLGLD